VGEGDLYLKLNFTSRVRRSSSTCSAPDDFADFALPAAPTGNEPWAQPVRLQWTGKFRIAPAITSDGALRLGKILGTEPAQPQPTTTGNIWACAPSAVLTGATVPSGNDCTEVSAPPLVPAMEQVGAAPYPAQFHLTSFNADVMVGDIPVLP
jgi:hypothetical protein